MDIQNIVTDSILTLNDRIAVLRFNRDDVRNALTGTGIMEDILRTIDWVNQNEDVSVLVMTGEGKAFSSGGNIKDIRNRDGDFSGDVDELESKYRYGIQRIPLVLETIEVPVIAAVNGPAIGAGCDLTCMCDIRIGSTNALFGETFVNLGLIPGDGGAWFLPKVVGYQRAAELSFTGRLVRADEAKELGLLLNVTDPEDLMTEVMALAATIAAKPPKAVRHTKRLMKYAQKMQLKEFLDMCALSQGICQNTEDHMTAVDAFLNKTTPKFKGR